MLFLLIFLFIPHAHTKGCEEWRFHALSIIKQSEVHDQLNPTHIGREIQSSSNRNEILDELYRRHFDLDRYLKILQNETTLNPALTAASLQKKERLLRSKANLQRLLRKFTGVARDFSIPEFEEIRSSYSTTATALGLKYRGNPDFAHTALKRRLEIETEIKILESKQKITSNDSEETLTKLAALFAEATYFKEMHDVSLGMWTGISTQTLQSSPYAPLLIP